MAGALIAVLAGLAAGCAEAPDDTPKIPDSPDGTMRALLDGLARVPAGGATDLGAAITAAAALVEGSEREIY